VKKPRRSSSLKALEKAAAKNAGDAFELKLFITGSTPKSLEAVAQLKEVCEAHLKGRYTLEVIDVHQQPQLAEAEQIIALPTLLKKLPPPLRKVLGTFSEKERLLAVLGLSPAKKRP
jgi:circadian clock protein KaiB